MAIPKRRARLGWREWIILPQFGQKPFKAKIDTGARTSALHAFDISPFDRDGEQWLAFKLHPVQRKRLPELSCEAKVLEQRMIRSSNGTSELRYVIRTTAMVAGKLIPIDLTLTNRDEMGFRMLLGREALKRRFLIDPGRSYLGGQKEEKPE